MSTIQARLSRAARRSRERRLVRLCGGIFVLRNYVRQHLAVRSFAIAALTAACDRLSPAYIARARLVADVRCDVAALAYGAHDILGCAQPIDYLIDHANAFLNQVNLFLVEAEGWRLEGLAVAQIAELEQHSAQEIVSLQSTFQRLRREVAAGMPDD